MRSYRTAPDPAVRLVCLPHAGGSASFFRGWGDGMPADVSVDAVCYPAREDRIDDPPLASLALLSDAVATALLDHGDVPVALFGHSMGASVAYEVALRLQERAPGLLRHLFVSGAEAPGAARHRPLDEWPDENVVAELHRTGGIGLNGYLEALDDPDLRPLLLRVLREDYRLLRTYRPSPDPPPLPVPMTVFRATGDLGCRPEAVAPWRDLTTSTCRLAELAGDHFYLVPRRAAVVALVGATITSRAVGARPGTIRDRSDDDGPART